MQGCTWCFLLISTADTKSCYLQTPYWDKFTFLSNHPYRHDDSALIRWQNGEYDGLFCGQKSIWQNASPPFFLHGLTKENRIKFNYKPVKYRNIYQLKKSFRFQINLYLKTHFLRFWFFLLMACFVSRLFPNSRAIFRGVHILIIRQRRNVPYPRP